MKKSVFLFFFVLFVALIPLKGVVGTQFPVMGCEDYNEKKVMIPSITMGKYTLLGMAFSKQAEKDLKTWISPIYNKFIAKKTDGGVFDVSYDYDINLFFIPMFTGANKLASKSAKKKIRSLSTKELYPHLLFYEGANTYKKELEFGKKNIPYFFILDKKGKVVYATSGTYDSKKIEEITDIIEEN